MNIGDNVSVKGWAGVAFSINAIQGDKFEVVMVGDDRKYLVGKDDVKALKGGEFCRDCGQIGCYHNSYE